MKVALLGPIAWRTPPVHYGPWELVTSLLAEGLVARGVDVTLFATGDSQTSATLEAVAPHGYAEDPSMDGRVWEALHVARVAARSGEFDLVHSHLDWLPLAFASAFRAPLLTTVHGFSGPGILPAYTSADPDLVSISDADRSPALRYVATVHHGVDVTALPYGDGADGDLVVLGRIHLDKGTADAIAIARAAGRRLSICGIVQDEQYFAEQVRPHVDGDRVVFHGAVGPTARAEILGAAGALLHPIHFDEPFGLSVVEAMVCGTPVVAYRRGSMAEVVDDGVTGVLLDPPGPAGAPDLDAAVAAVERAGAMDRVAVREGAVQRFSVDRMVDDYLAVYEQVLTAARGTATRAARSTASPTSTPRLGSRSVR